jgi:hypothetical protein
MVGEPGHAPKGDGARVARCHSGPGGHPPPLLLRFRPQPAAGTGAEPAGFWLGLWHGIVLPVTFAISLFTDNGSVYEAANN